MNWRTRFSGLGWAAFAATTALGCGSTETKLGSNVAPVHDGRCEDVGRRAPTVDGCSECTCSAEGTWRCTASTCDSVECPAVAAPTADFCNQGTPALTKDANGCEEWTCSPSTCLPVAAPPADACPGGTPELVTGRDGCEEWTCSPSTCPPVAAPPSDACPGGTPELVTGADGCPNWTCSSTTVDACAVINGKTYKSLEKHECGHAPGGVALCHWALSFDDVGFRWRHSDVGEGGEYTCSGLVIEGTSGVQKLAGRLDPKTGHVTWEGVVYAPE